ncbi:YtpI family protein [Metabacillus herbersteinensis]|uniref:YtpI family protein n=1 Tax=Metabacillus herbersteinensis TaxID=283816 RepID=A0ABV6GMI7_9BACI
MNVLVILILSSLFYYLYFKVTFFKSNSPIEKKWISTKSRIALGLFIGFYGLNQLFLDLSIIGIIVGIIFSLVGFVSTIIAVRQYKFYLPLVIEEENDLSI